MTADAMHCKRETAQAILDNGADYVLGRSQGLRLPREPKREGEVKAWMPCACADLPESGDKKLSRTLHHCAAQRVTTTGERVTALRKAHPEWNEALTPKAAARKRLATSTKFQRALSRERARRQNAAGRGRSLRRLPSNVPHHAFSVAQ